jgi:hypothetical protein
MRPVFDPRLFPGLPKFLWFDNGDGSGGDSSGPGGDAASTGGGTGATTGVGSGAAPGTSTTSADAAAAGIGGVGSAGQAASVGGSSDAASAFGGGGGQTSVTAAPGNANAGVSDAAAQGMAFGGGGGGSTARGGGGAAPGGGSTGGPGAATGGGGTGGPGAATGGGGGTAAGGSGISASVRSALQALLGGNPTDALRGAVRNSALDFGGVAGVPSLGVPEGVGGTGAAPVGQVTVSPLGPPSSLTSIAQQLFGPSAGKAAPSSGSSTAAPDNLGPAMALLRGGLQAQQGGMGFPSIEGVSPGLTAAPAGPTQGFPSVIGPAGPNGPSAFASNVDNAPSGQTSGLGSAAPASAAVSSPATPAPPTQPDIGGLLQLVMSLVMGGNSGPQLSQLAQNTPAYNRMLRRGMPNAPPESQFWNAQQWDNWMSDPQNAPPPPPTQPVDPSQLVS